MEKKGEAMKMNKFLNISKAELNIFEIKYVFVKKSISIYFLYQFFISKEPHVSEITRGKDINFNALMF